MFFQMLFLQRRVVSKISALVPEPVPRPMTEETLRTDGWKPRWNGTAERHPDLEDIKIVGFSEVARR